MLQAMNTGHDGSMTTVHANTPKEAISRLETLCLMAGMDLPVRAIREQIAGAVHLIVQIGRLSDGSRKVKYITEVVGMREEGIVMQDIFILKKKDLTAIVRSEAAFKPQGNMPTLWKNLNNVGLQSPEIYLLNPHQHHKPYKKKALPQRPLSAKAFTGEIDEKT